MTAADATVHHPSPELLSAFLDDELARAEADDVARHLEGCPRCRTRLDGLRRVLARFDALERQAPPPLLAERVARRVAVERRPRGLVERIEEALGRIPSRPEIFLGFALVVGLAAISLIYGERLGREGRSAPDAPSIAVPMSPTPPPGEPPGRAGTADPLAGRSLQAIVVDGRVLERRDGGWWEQGVEAVPDSLPTVTLDDPALAPLRADWPALDRLVATGEPVVLLLDGTPHRLEPGGWDGAGPPESRPR